VGERHGRGESSGQRRIRAGEAHGMEQEWETESRSGHPDAGTAVLIIMKFLFSFGNHPLPPIASKSIPHKRSHV
jgi:hypothetical protein